MTLALYGGSFNPPHNGHVTLARHALETLRPCKLIWMPSGNPPHKELAEGTPSAAHRLEMSRLAAKSLGCIAEVSDFELEGGARYTVDTVKMLIAKYAPKKIWLLMGRDMWDSFHVWHRAEELRELVEPYVFSRDVCPVSSTKMRGFLDAGSVPPAVFRYIQKEKLYGFAGS